MFISPYLFLGGSLQCAFGKSKIFRLAFWSQFTPQCPFGKSKIFLIHGLRPIKIQFGKFVCEQPIFQIVFWHCSLLS